MLKNPLFRGCTRPPMFMGVPYIPFFMGAGSGLLMAMYFNMWFLLWIPISVFVMRQMARRDEMIFRLLGLRLQFRTRVRNLQEHDGTWVFSPNNYREPGKAKR
ncbi:type IV secretion system protein VirB3 [Luteibacter sp. UNC138MFCol5.1]|uniref:type IV secretion system protein VirB3 n=1 Tax=Luteibacter sp. UNC138MFCol5.1 TaxID=1502774 RepID=UPI0008BDF02B|nr:VirB3 family type IV secretion system protein [Luteibacter sp. UNC138MFCol5.1]SEO82306.1 type IV secretion system protein VirB3 [Luteibacter sp. UNC138MFCol5.1]